MCVFERINVLYNDGMKENSGTKLKKGRKISPTISRRETSFRIQGDPESHLNLTRATINGKLRRQAE